MGFQSLDDKVGNFITVEGGEGVGKSLFTNSLFQYLKEQGIDLILTREPGGTPTSDLLRELFKKPLENDPLSPLAELFLVSAARAQHIDKRLRPALTKGAWIICDRFYDSTRVYQGKMQHIPQERYENVIAHSINGFEPNLTFLLDCPVDVVFERLEKRKKEHISLGKPLDCDRFDEQKSSYHVNLRQAYLEVARDFPERIVVLDASKSPETVVGQAVGIIRKRFGVGCED